MLPRLSFVMWLVLTTILPLPVDSIAQTAVQREKCELIRKRIRRIESRMRAGYSVNEGNRLAERLRELKRARSKTCR